MLPAAPASLAGDLLLAMPGIGDPRFERSVIALCTHDEGGALGIGIGSVVQGLTLHALYRQLELDVGVVPDRPVHIGGPVEQQRGFVLHSLDWTSDETLCTQERWGLTGTLDILRALAEGSGPKSWLAALGYAGWSPGQLDEEMTRHGWFVAPASDELLFEVAPPQRWQAAFAGAGIDTRLLASGAGRA